MTGAIIGDIVGSRFEFNNRKTKLHALYTPLLFYGRYGYDPCRRKGTE